MLLIISFNVCFDCRRDMAYKLLLGIGYVWLLTVN